MHTVQLTDADVVPASEADVLAGRWLDRRHYDRVVRDTATVLKPDGTPLLIYVRDALPRRLCRLAFETFKSVPVPATHPRRLAAGGAQQVPSATVGFYDRHPRAPYCRASAFNLDHRREFGAARPFFSAISEAYRALAPQQWQAQRAF